MGFPPTGVLKNEVLMFRPVTSTAIAPAKTWSLSSMRRAAIATDQTNKGVRSRDILSGNSSVNYNFLTEAGLFVVSLVNVVFSISSFLFTRVSVLLLQMSNIKISLAFHQSSANNYFLKSVQEWHDGPSIHPSLIKWIPKCILWQIHSI